MSKYIELKENTEYDRVVNEYNNHYGYDLITNEYSNNYGYNINGKEHSSHKTPEEHISPYNTVNDDISLKKR